MARRRGKAKWADQTNVAEEVWPPVRWDLHFSRILHTAGSVLTQIGRSIELRTNIGSCAIENARY
jgi:hypothetical protein